MHLPYFGYLQIFIKLLVILLTSGIKMMKYGIWIALEIRKRLVKFSYVTIV